MPAPGTFEGGGGGFGPLVPSDRPLRRTKPKTIDLAGARAGMPVPWAYGRHMLAGNVVFEGRSGSDTIVLLALGEGEWHACEVLFVNGVPFDITDTSRFHFHPGLDGEDGVESAPSTRNQKVCSFFPTNFWPRVTFARTCYVALALPPDSGAPDNQFRIQGIYRTRRVRIFDANGNQTGYQYSANPADCVLDLLIERFIKPRSRINEGLTSAEKANFDFGALDAWRSACNATVLGEKRWEFHAIWTEATTLQAAVELALELGRAYRVIKNGQWGASHDEARSSALTLGMDALLWPIELPEKALDALPNRLRLDYRDLQSGIGRGTISSSGTTVTGSGTDFTRWYKKDQAIQLRSGPQEWETRKIASVDSDTQITLASAFSANQSAGTLHGNPWLDFQEASRVFEDHDLQDQAGLITDENRSVLYCGSSTPKRIDRLGRYLLARRTRSKGFRGRVVLAYPGANDLLPGDVVTAPARDDFTASRDYRITEIEELPDGGRILTGEEYDASVFTDVAGAQQPAAPALPDLHQPYSAPGLHESVARRKSDTNVGVSSTGAAAWETAGTIANMRWSRNTQIIRFQLTALSGNPARRARFAITDGTLTQISNELSAPGNLYVVPDPRLLEKDVTVLLQVIDNGMLPVTNATFRRVVNEVQDKANIV